MNKFNKILMSSLSSLCVFLSAANAMADETEEKNATSEAGAILFRIENIKPVQNKDGIVDKCTFVVTTYNRMEKGIREAKLNFTWQDNISAKYTINGNDIEVNKGKEAQTTVSTEVTLTNIMPHRQKSFEASVNTDKCFLLFDNLQYTVSSCANEGDKIERKNNGRSMNNNSKSQENNTSVGSCANNFDYIDSQNPEYYSEFKDVPESVIAEQVENEKNIEVEKITTGYGKLMGEFSKISDILSAIK